MKSANGTQEILCSGNWINCPLPKKHIHSLKSMIFWRKFTMKNDQITLSQALQGYALYAKARRLSPNTLNDYNNTFTKFKDFLGTDPPLAEITKYQQELRPQV
jgi:hypothetical protein